MTTRLLARAGGWLLPLLPALLLLALVAGCFSTTPRAFVPAWEDGDELGYWHEIATFATHGFRGGHYSIEELPPKAGFTTFGTHGPAFPAIWGSVARLAGWQLASPVYGNLAAVTLAILLLVLLVRPAPGQSLLLAGVLTLFYPLQLYLPSGMQEATHYALALVLAGLFHRLAIRSGGAARLPLLLLPPLLLIAILLRPTWGVLVFPLVLLSCRQADWRRLMFALFATVAVLLAGFALFSFWSAPYPDNFLAGVLQRATAAPTTALADLWRHTRENLALYLSSERCTPLEVVQRLAVTGLLVWSVLQLCSGGRWSSPAGRSALAAGSNLLLITLISLVCYEVSGSRDFRLSAPHLLFALVLAVLAARPYLPLALAALYLTVLPPFLAIYQGAHTVHFLPGDKPLLMASFRQQLLPQLRYRPDAGPWQNALLVDIADYEYPLALVPPGIGLNAVLDWSRPTTPLKSGFLLLSAERARQVATHTRLKPLAVWGERTLYQNLDSPGGKRP